MVDLGDHGQGVQVLHIRPVGVMLDAVALAVADPHDLLPGTALGDLGDGIVKFPAGHEIHLGAGGQRFLGQDAHLRAHQAHQNLGIFLLEAAHGFQIMTKRGAGGEEHRQFEIRGQGSHLGHRQVLRGGVHHPGLRDESGRVAEPGGIPEGSDLPGGLVARAGAAVKILE